MNYYLNKIKKKKQKNNPRKGKQIEERGKDFQNCTKLAFFRVFEISNPNIFVLFGFPKKNFVLATNLLSFPKKIYRLVLPIQPKLSTTLGGGVNPVF